MKKKTDDYLNTRIWVRSHRKLRIIAALTNSTVVEVIDRLAQQEIERMGPVQINDQQEEKINTIQFEAFNEMMDKRLREDPEFRARYEEAGKHVAERERENSKNVYSQRPSK